MGTSVDGDDFPTGFIQGPPGPPGPAGPPGKKVSELLLTAVIKGNHRVYPYLT